MRRTPKPEPLVRTLFFGTSEFAVPSLRAVAAGTQLSGVVTQPDRPSGRGQKLTPTPVKKTALELGVPIYEPVRLRDFAREREGAGDDLFVLASYGRILPAALLALPKHGALNVHPSLLPRYRGATPLQTALRNGDAETGVTIMMMDAGMDTGPIVLQERFPISPEDTYGSLHDRLAIEGARLLQQAIEMITAGEVRAYPQTGEPSITKPLQKEDLTIDWSWTVSRIVNTVRAFAQQPGARGNLAGIPVKILAAQQTPSADAFEVPAADGPVFVTRIIAPNKGAMSGAAFEQYAKAAR